MQMTEKRRAGVPVVFHNGSGYDWKFGMKEIGTAIEEEEKYSEIKDLTKKIDKKKKIDVLGLNSEKDIAFKWNNMWFIDSFKFMNSSLSNIVGTLTKEDMELANKLYKLNGVKPNQIDALSKKNIFPYIWFNNYEKETLRSFMFLIIGK